MRLIKDVSESVAGVRTTDPSKPPVDKYLHQEMRDRLDVWPARFILKMKIVEAGDDLNDPTRPWPMKRVKVVMGTLTSVPVPDPK